MEVVTVVVTHDVFPGQLAEAAERIIGNGKRMAEQPGFLDRELLMPADGSETLVTITRWENEQAYKDWKTVNAANRPQVATKAPFDTPRTSVFVSWR